MAREFDAPSRIHEDECSRNDRTRQNMDILNYQTFNNVKTNLEGRKACDTAAKSLQEFYTNNYMRIRDGYGVSSSCMVEEDSKIRFTEMTTDKGRQQLFARTFQGCPNFSSGSPQPVKESEIQQGHNTYNATACDGVPTREFLPMIPCLRTEIQNPDNIVEAWTRGGEHTRDTLKQKAFLEKNGYVFDGKTWAKKQCGRA